MRVSVEPVNLRDDEHDDVDVTERKRECVCVRERGSTFSQLPEEEARFSRLFSRVVRRRTEGKEWRS